MKHQLAIMWFRNDLRLADNPALLAALKESRTVLPVYLHTPQHQGPLDGPAWDLGGASRWWLHHSLASLQKSLLAAGTDLYIFQGHAPDEALAKLLAQTGATAVYWNRRYEPGSIASDKSIKGSLQGTGVDVQTFPGNVLREPWEVLQESGKPYQVYSPYYRRQMALGPMPLPLDAPESRDLQAAAPLKSPTNACSLESLSLLPKIKWDSQFYSTWQPGETSALSKAHSMIGSKLRNYSTQRDIPSVDGTSTLSPHLRFGEISPRMLWQIANDGTSEHFMKEICWREFAYSMLYHFPQTANSPLRQEFQSFPWEFDERIFNAWTKGQTGYPIIDAGMRQLWQTGWMHNRVRMIVASFLVKHLLHSWEMGASWFWDTLVDADLASNTLGWQWAGGCGADAAPYFRIFNPVLQGEKFDPGGIYVKHWCPEYQRHSPDSIHKPWTKDPNHKTLIDLHVGRDRALAALATLKK